ncbi:MAG TPA: hypothetical protein VF244_00665, partial [Acidimicrobiales bacterium]
LWPAFPSAVWGRIEVIRQLQLVQHQVGHIEARVIGPRALSRAEEAELSIRLHQYFPWPFELTLTYLREIDRQRGIKFEDFVSLVDR